MVEAAKGAVTQAFLNEHGIFAEPMCSPLTDEDALLVFDIINVYARAIYILRFGLAIAHLNDESFCASWAELNDTDVLRHAKQLFGRSAYARFDQARLVQTIELLERRAHMRHLCAHWLIKRSPVGPEIVAFSTDAKRAASQHGGKWMGADDPRRWQHNYAILFVEETKKVRYRLFVEVDGIINAVQDADYRTVG